MDDSQKVVLDAKIRYSSYGSTANTFANSSYRFIDDLVLF